MKKIFTLLFISGLLVSIVSTAQFALREEFIYPANFPLVNGLNPYWKNPPNGGTSGQILVTSPGLTYTGYKTANVGTNKISLVSGNSEDITGFIDIDGDLDVDSHDSIPLNLMPVFYYSLLIKVNATTGLTVNSGAGDYFSAIVPAVNSNTYVSRLFIRQGSTSGYQLGLKINSNGTNATVWATGVGDNMVIGTTYLLAFRYTSNPGDYDDVAEMWINPVLDGTIPTPNVTATNASTTADLTQLGGVLFREGTSTPTVDVDAIAAGISWYDVVLPTGIQSFNATLQNSKAQLNWELPAGQGLKGFYVERSNDGRLFESIGFVASGNANNYSFDDANVRPGINYYRLKLMKTDGTFTYSGIVVIMNQQFVKTTIFPNPVNSNLTIAHDLAGANAVARILDMSGKLMMQVNLQTGATQTALSLPTLARGAYMLVLENNGQKTVSRFIKD